MLSAEADHNVLCFGEVLWDRLPDGAVPGGAPTNVAYHLAKSGCTAWLVSAVGDDEPGAELRRRLRHWGVRDDYVGLDTEKPTGAVNVSLQDGSPTYEIVDDVAWDRIVVDKDLVAACGQADAIVYGSLAQRHPHNRDCLAQLLEHMPSSLKVFDVNLRAPYDDLERIWQLTRKADLVKLNDEEIGRLLGIEDATLALETHARTVARQSRCDRLCVTAGPQGAGLLIDESWYWTNSETIAVSDTVGAGDAFLAALVAGLIQTPEAPQSILTAASRLAAFVASQRGATPDYENVR